MFTYLKTILTYYTTTRLVRIRSTFLAVVYLVVVTFMWLTFFLGWLHLDVKKAYQKSCPVMGVVSAKVKGFASTEYFTANEIGSEILNPDLYRRTWDFIDLVSPPFGGEGQYTGFTVATNFVITKNQTRGTCPDEKQENLTICTEDIDCLEKNGTWIASGHGVYTGRCRSGSCEISGWCPIEDDQKSQLPFQGRRALLEGVKDFTVLIKNSVGFPGCGKHKGQNIRFKDEHHLKHCIHHPIHQPKCPIFKIGDIVKWSNENFSEVAIKGGVFKVEISWVCDFDFGNINDCEPKYSFSRVDDKTFFISKGWNFRYADYHEENRRTLFKVYGLQILISAVGEGRKFDLFEAIISLGAMVGLFAVASLICDFLFDILCLLNKLHCQAMKNYTPDLRFGSDSDHHHISYGKAQGTNSVKNRKDQENNAIKENECMRKASSNSLNTINPVLFQEENLVGGGGSLDEKFYQEE